MVAHQHHADVELLDYHVLEAGAPPDVAAFARELVEGVLANSERLDAILEEASQNWKVAQMAKVDRTVALGVLRIADSLEAPQWNVENPKTAPYRKAR